MINGLQPIALPLGYVVIARLSPQSCGANSRGSLDGWTRTNDPSYPKRALCQTELHPEKECYVKVQTTFGQCRFLGRLVRFELTISWVTTKRVSPLPYKRHEILRIRPLGLRYPSRGRRTCFDSASSLLSGRWRDTSLSGNSDSNREQELGRHLCYQLHHSRIFKDRHIIHIFYFLSSHVILCRN